MVLLLYLIVLATSSFATPATGDGEASPEIELEPFAICNATKPWHYYLPNSSFEANLAKISAAFPSVASANGGFAKGPVGAAPDTVYGLALCRGDTDGDSCKTCIEKAFQDAQSSCGYGKDAAVYHDRCHVRISDSDFLAPNTNEPTRDMWNPSNITEPSTFLGLEWDAEEDSESVALVIGGLVSAFLRETAKFAADNTPGRFATAAMDIGGLELYSMAQCTPDLLTPVCVQCLEDIIIRGTPASFKTRQGRRFLGVRCSFRYESYSFYEGKPMWIFGPTPYQGQRRDRSMRKLISAIGAVISLLLLLVCFFLGFGWMRSRRKEKVHLQVRPTVGLHQGEALMWTTEGNVSSDFCLFDFPQIQQATNNFSEENKLGQGGFGPVYKGELPDGMEIAVKRLCTNSGQGFVEFKNEVQLIAKLQHTNLVRLLGCCSQEEEKMLVYEYLPNRSLDLFIFDTPEKRVLLEWKKRLLIVQGIVQGLLYLHKHSRLHIIHRDLKASNILLDHNMNPKISDFGIAKIFISNDTEDNTNTVVGTYGYMAPEYAYEGLFSSKSDVFSFGVLLLEIISGKRNSIIRQNGCSLNLLGYAWHLWKEGKWIDLVDTSLVIENCTSELSKCINIALLCVQENAADRPTMWDVSTMISTEGASLPEPKQPAYYNGRVAKSLHVGLELHSINEVTITAQEGR